MKNRTIEIERGMAVENSPVQNPVIGYMKIAFLNDIIIPDILSTPNPKKMEKKEQYFLDNGVFQSEIILDGQYNLVNGYTSYLLAQKYGMKLVPVVVCKRQVVKAYHKKGGRIYAWELSWRLIGQVKPGDKLIVDTSIGFRTVRAVSVEEYDESIHGTLKQAIRKPRKHNKGSLSSISGSSTKETTRKGVVSVFLDWIKGLFSKMSRSVC